MKISNRKNKIKPKGKWLGYFIMAYLLASYGVNGIINPLQYFRSAARQAEILEISEHADGIIIELPQDQDMARMKFLSFQAEAAENHSFISADAVICPYIPADANESADFFASETSMMQLGDSSDENMQEICVNVWKGWNSVDISMLLWTGIQWERIMLLPSEEAGKIVLKNVELSADRKADVGRMLYVWISFLFLTACWEGICWMKERYADDRHGKVCG